MSSGEKRCGDGNKGWELIKGDGKGLQVMESAKE